MTEPVDQPHPDTEWIETLPIELQGAAKAHGRAMLAFVVNSGNYHAAVNIILRRVRGNHELMSARQVIASGVADMSQAYASLRGWTKEQLNECQQDIVRAAQLSQAEPTDQKTTSGIILLKH